MVIRYLYNLLIIDFNLIWLQREMLLLHTGETFLSDLHTAAYFYLKVFSIMSTILSSITRAIKVLKVWTIELIKTPPHTITRCIALRI